MSIPLLHFPYVVQKEIFKSMEYCELFIMSLCSKRMKYCVIRAKRKVPELWYGVNPALKFIALQEGESPVDVIIAFDDQPELSGMKPMELEIGDNFKTRGIVKTVQSTLDQEFCSIRLPKLDAKVTKALHEHVKQLFLYTVPCGIEIDNNSLTEELPVYENVNRIHVTGGSILELNDLDTFLSQSYPNLGTLMINCPINGEVNDSSKILEVSNIYLSKPGLVGASLLSKFTGRNIVFSHLVIAEKELNLFIRKWMNSEAYHHSEMVFFSAPPDYNLNTGLIIDELETEEFDPTKRPQWYQIDFKLFNIPSSPADFSGDNCFDVIRESDGKRASILSFSNFFMFLVWN
ncbi:hypothetical protein CRE_14266 [Caenorhabditis remanei]|uniref:F-box domain-containing protein n=1 Tax=Caenorhabditis remanei TaxID=31234 RepID=E3N7M3_CAERE|nr:hypothetical protein CRE_14266 [Caenorhabditis remanei]